MNEDTDGNSVDVDFIKRLDSSEGNGNGCGGIDVVIVEDGDHGFVSGVGSDMQDTGYSLSLEHADSLMDDAPNFISFFESCSQIVLENIRGIISVVIFEDEPEFGCLSGGCGDCSGRNLEGSRHEH